MLSRPALSPDELRQHMAGTYFALRTGMGVLAIALPLLLAAIGPLADGEPIRCSMSAYYFSVRMRDVFVGLLVAIGAFLFLYKGFSREENWSLNLAGALAIGIALVPTTGRCDGSGETLSLHTAFAFSFFLVIAGVCILLAADTLRLINDPARVRLFQRIYRLYGSLMIALPIAVVLLSRALDRGEAEFPVIFLVEAAGVFTFAAFWITKSFELRQTHADQHALAGLVKTEEPGTTAETRPTGRLVQVGVLGIALLIVASAPASAQRVAPAGVTGSVNFVAASRPMLPVELNLASRHVADSTNRERNVVIGVLVGAVTGVALGYGLAFLGRAAYCESPQQCSEYPRRAIRESTRAGFVIGAGIGGLIGWGLD